MPITRREAKEIVDWVIQEIRRRSFPYSTDGKLDLSKSPVGQIVGTETSGGPIGNSAIWDRHVAPNADIQGTKVRVATVSERGTVELAEDGESASSLAVQSNDSRLHDVTPADSAEHDARYGSTVSGLGASLIGVSDGEGDFAGEEVEAVLHELFAALGATTFLALTDSPSSYENRYPQVPTINEAEDGVEWRPVDYYDGGDITEDYAGAKDVNRTAVADGNSATMNDTLDGGEISEYGQDSPDRSYWDDLRTPVNLVKTHSVKPPVWTNYKGSQVLAFEDQAVNYQVVYWVWQMPHGYELGTDVMPHIHIVPEDGTAGNVHWEFTYSLASRDAVFPTQTIIHNTQTMPEVADFHERFILMTISGAELGTDLVDISDVLLCSLARRSDEADDTYTGKDVYLLEVDLHHRIDAWGARTFDSK